jgi:hypothetical protein
MRSTNSEGSGSVYGFRFRGGKSPDGRVGGFGSVSYNVLQLGSVIGVPGLGRAVRSWPRYSPGALTAWSTPDTD